MQNLIVYVNFSHFRLHSFSHLLFESFVLIICLISYFSNTSLFNEIRQLEGSFVYTSLVLQISSLLTPVSRNWYRITNHFHFHQELWVFSCNIPCLNHVWPSNLHLEIKNLHAA